jgi:hypothetical protein
MTEPLTEYQRAALAVYADGDFQYLESYQFDDEYGDSLLTFVMAELSTNEDCESRDMAISRIEGGIADLQAVLDALWLLPDDAATEEAAA